MDKVQEQAHLIGKKISPLISTPLPNITTENLGDFKIPGGDTQPPATSPPSPPPPQSPPPSPPPTTASPPPTPPPPPSVTNPPPSPPQPPPQNIPGEPPPEKPLPPPPLPLQPPPSAIQPNTRPADDPHPNPISPPSLPNSNSQLPPPTPVDPGEGGVSPPLSYQSQPAVPQTPDPQTHPFQPPDSPLTGGQNSQPALALSPPPHSSSGPTNHSGSSNPSNVNHRNGSNGHGNGSSYDQRTMVGIGIAGAVVITFIVVMFLVRKRNRKRVTRRSGQHYLPSANFVVKSDGYNYYAPKPGNGNNSGQNSSGEIPNQERTPDSAVIGTTKTLFTYEDLSQITQGFAKANVVGEGGFGYVYKGVFPDGQNVAIKQLKSSNAEGYREFKAEVEIISRVHHRHLVSLAGYCISEQHRFLIYEFVPNNTLDHHLHGRDLHVLDWTKRVNIAIGAAKGLAYLHEDCHPRIIHRDIKSSNILLDEEFEAKVADFGLARLNDTTQSHISTRVMGTFGYLAPEYASSGKLTDRSDVYSFGVVLLELITGRKPVDPSQPLGDESLVEWARPRLIEAIETGDINNLVDQRLKNQYDESEVYRMIETAASCVRHSAPKRPRMAQVVRALDNRKELSDLTNGVKVGQSTAYSSGQYSQEIRNFRRNSFSSNDFSDYTSREYASHELEIRALNT
ncbi:PREDICTED: putative proline-rich receptor-like protein kinase PERK11 isoform X2 [Tarenaya hassleriana]|uniref:putative proline-rich receptor-like protein kinase PERK11 isoform X2 n=1 Tax=Tarenaya hassleriana TaxID=28532 RepID=UPI00053C5C8D|nr:PREDICTED: putative proline-rich receptor-like protein kinase PERK11 isoform X2 [Tarenaya hassleriana]